ncbi:MAG: thiamine diphosphokinase [Clostridia bacterium]|nr:thiamine diphosphokinase [Clostridia bacterium]
MSRICYIFAAGQWDGSGVSPVKGDYVIAADAGYLHLKQLGIKPDLIVGDMDSLDEAPAGVQITKYPSVKDDTDTLLAVKIGLDKGYKEFRIFAGTGGRLDHTIANLQVLQYISRRGGQGYLVSNKQVITAITNDTMRFPKNCYDTVSIFALGETAEGVSISGMEYSLRNAQMDPYYPIGVSNKLVGKSATVSVKRGTLVIIWTRQ